MVIKIVVSQKVGNYNFIAGQEYEYIDTVNMLGDCDSCDKPVLQMQKGFATPINGKSFIIPSTIATLIKQDEPDASYADGYLDQYVRRATDDYVVLDGDYTKAVKERLGISIAPKPRPDQADYAQDRIREALKYNRRLLIGEELEEGPTILEPEEIPVPSSIIGELIIGTGIIQAGHTPTIGEFIIGYDTIQSS